MGQSQFSFKPAKESTNAVVINKTDYRKEKGTRSVAALTSLISNPPSILHGRRCYEYPRNSFKNKFLQKHKVCVPHCKTNVLKLF